MYWGTDRDLADMKLLSFSLSPPPPPNGKSLCVPRGHRGRPGMQPRRHEQTQLELGPNPTQGAAWEMEKTGRSAEREPGSKCLDKRRRHI